VEKKLNTKCRGSWREKQKEFRPSLNSWRGGKGRETRKHNEKGENETPDRKARGPHRATKRAQQVDRGEKQSVKAEGGQEKIGPYHRRKECGGKTQCLEYSSLKERTEKGQGSKEG